MTAVTNNRRRPWPRSPMTTDAHDRGHPKKKIKKKKKKKNKIQKKKKKKKKRKKKKEKKKKKKKERRSWRRSPITGVAHDRGRPWPRSPKKKKK